MVTNIHYFLYVGIFSYLVCPAHFLKLNDSRVFQQKDRDILVQKCPSYISGML